MARNVTVDIIIPPLGDESVDCQLSQWLVAVGDFVKEGEPVLILETEKTAIEIHAPSDGVLGEVYVFEGEEVIESERVGTIRAELYDDEAEGEDDDDDDDDDLDDEDDEDLDDDEDDYEVEEDDDDFDEEEDTEGEEEFGESDEDFDA